MFTPAAHPKKTKQLLAIKYKKNQTLKLEAQNLLTKIHQHSPAFANPLQLI